MYTETTLHRELNTLKNDYEAQMPGWYSRDYYRSWGQEVRKAWTIYLNARNNTLETLLLGGEDIRTDRALTTNFGTTSANPVANPGGTRTERHRQSGSNRTGSVLKERYWWPMINDAWLIGGCHGLSQFHVAAGSTAAITDEMLWDSSVRVPRPRVMGREIIGLFAFGYIRVSHAYEATLGLVFAPHNDTTAKAATFTDYLTRIGWVNSASNIRNMMDPNVTYANFTLPG